MELTAYLSTLFHLFVFIGATALFVIGVTLVVFLLRVLAHCVLKLWNKI